MSHLLPSSASFGGFLPARDAGLVGRAGRLAALAADETGEADARSSGFLCVISLLSTFLRPFVTSPPSSSKRPLGAAGAAVDPDEEGTKVKASWPYHTNGRWSAISTKVANLDARYSPWGSMRLRSYGTS